MALRNSKCRVSWKSSDPAPPSANIWLMMPTMSALASSPSPTPTTPDTNEYAVPSKTNIWTRCHLLAPTARAMPSSERRGAASITKIRKMSRNAHDDGEQAEEDEEAGHQAADLLSRVQQAPLDVNHHELRQRYHQSVDLAGKLFVSSASHSFQEFGAYILVREEEISSSLNSGLDSSACSRTRSSRAVSDKRAFAPSLKLLHDFPGWPGHPSGARRLRGR